MGSGMLSLFFLVWSREWGSRDVGVELDGMVQGVGFLGAIR